MNDVIDEIAFRSGCRRNSFYDPRPPVIEGWIIAQKELDTFAELIIRECVARGQEVFYNRPDDIQRFPADEILNYFGVVKND